jgi:hypothetical protein
MDKHILKSIGAIIAGLVVIAGLAAIADALLQRLGILSIPQEVGFTSA